MRALALLTCMLVACDPTIPLSLDAAARNGSGLEVSSDASTITLSIYGGGATCPELEEATAMIAGVEMTKVSAGKYQPGDERICLGGGHCNTGGCEPTKFTAPATRVRIDAPETTFTVSDRTAIWTMTVLQLRARRALTLVDPSVPLTAGGSVVMQWSPAGDVATDLFGHYATSEQVAKQPGTGVSVQAVYAGGRITAPTPRAGTWVFQLYGGPAAAVSACSGPAACGTQGFAAERPKIQFTVQ